MSPPSALGPRRRAARGELAAGIRLAARSPEIARRVAELNRTALRQIGVNWLDTRNNAILGSTVGNLGTVTATGNAAQNSAFSPRAYLPGSPGTVQAPGFVPIASTYGATASAAYNGSSQLFGVFNAGSVVLGADSARALRRSRASVPATSSSAAAAFVG